MSRKNCLLHGLAALMMGCAALTLHAEMMTLPELRSAAEKGDADAQFELGLCNSLGYCMKKDPAAARQWFGKAAAQGHKAARAACVVEGYDSSASKKAARESLRKAAEEGDAWAQFYLGTCCGDHDPRQAVRWFREAALQGNAWGQVLLGMAYLGIVRGVPQDQAQGARWCTKAAEQGHAMGQMFLGGCYAGGAGVTRDPAKAVHWLRKSADQGYEPARAMLKKMGY